MTSAIFNTRSQLSCTLGDTIYREADGLPSGILPTKKEVIECMLYLLRPSRAGSKNRSRVDAALVLSHAVVEHWEYCNIYTINFRYVKSRIIDIYTKFQTIKKNRKRDNDDKLKMYNEDMKKLFDIYCTDETSRKAKEKETGIIMGDMENEFLQDMKTARIGYCLDQVDRKWQRTMERKSKREMSLHAKQGDVGNISISGPEYEASFAEIDENLNVAAEHYDDPDFERETDAQINEGSEPSKKKRREVTDKVPIEQTMSDKLPQEYRHLRNGVRSVKPELYRVVDKLISVYHCSYHQALAGVIETGNTMFSRKWKFNEESEVIDLDTAPVNKEFRIAGKSILCQTLSEIVEEIMSGSDVVVTYHEDGSKKKGCGSFSVQGVTVDGKYRAFPTLPIASESRENLAALKRTILDILSCVNGTYTAKDIFEKITFRVSDGVSHNYNVDDLVALDLGTDHIPGHLLCHTHPVLMFSRKLVEAFSSIENAIGSDKIYSKFLVETTNTHDSVTEQYIHCIVNLFSPEFNHKSWNQSTDFNLHIVPDQNMAVGFRTERFNRFVFLCAVLLYHDNHVWSFLQKYENVTNNLACIVRAFEDVEFLKIHCAVGALIGIHLVEPYLSLTTSTDVSYSKLTVAMKQLYTDLTTTDPNDLLNISKPAFAFVSKKRFKYSVKSWDKKLITSVQAFVNIHSGRILSVLKLVLPKLADGFHLQRANVFGFGNFDPENQMLVANKDMSKLDKAPINNLASERHVGSVNYGLSVHGANQLEIVSSSIVKAKSYDLVELKPIDEFVKYRSLSRKDSKVLDILKQWGVKQEQLQEDGLQIKEIKNNVVEKRKNKDLEHLKVFAGPFTSPDEVDAFLSSPKFDDSAKEKRMYLEVRYARDTSLSLPKNSPIFRLKEKHKNLSVPIYQQNLKTYLSKVSCNVDVDWEDFDEAVRKLSEV